jgi:hypothetical protein
MPCCLLVDLIVAEITVALCPAKFPGPTAARIPVVNPDVLLRLLPVLRAVSSPTAAKTSVATLSYHRFLVLLLL